MAVAETYDLPEALDTATFSKELEDIVDAKERNRIFHPFVEAVANGTATKNQIGGWILQFAMWADPCNKYLGTMWANCPDDDIREGILDNMREEEHGYQSGIAGHVELIHRTCDAVGWDANRRANEEKRYESWALHHWFEVVMTRRPFVESICATSFTAERMNHVVFAKLEKGLREHYDLTEDAMLSVAVHASDVEEEHASLGPLAIQRYGTTAYDQENIRFAVTHTADMYYKQYNVWEYY
jgi:pyrroloquinoline quinone (PQQ) biosynthesis protein C